MLYKVILNGMTSAELSAMNGSNGTHHENRSVGVYPKLVECKVLVAIAHDIGMPAPLY
jgi:hypothetical protein